MRVRICQIIVIVCIILSSFILFAQEPQPDYLVSVTTSSPRDSVIDNKSSGTLVDPEYVLTCNHNIEPAHTSITVGFQNGDEVAATVVFRNRIYDLAILKLGEVRYEKPVEISDTDYVRRSQTATVLGFDQEVTGEVFLGGRTAFRLRGKEGTLGGPALIDGKLVGVSAGWFRFTGIRCTNTPAVREFLEKIE